MKHRTSSASAVSTRKFMFASGRPRTTGEQNNVLSSGMCDRAALSYHWRACILMRQQKFRHTRTCAGRPLAGHTSLPLSSSPPRARSPSLSPLSPPPTLAAPPPCVVSLPPPRAAVHGPRVPTPPQLAPDPSLPTTYGPLPYRTPAAALPSTLQLERRRPCLSPAARPSPSPPA